MRRLATGVLLAGLLALGTAAAVDALLPGGQRLRHEPAAPEARGAMAEAAAALRAAGATGTLVYSDEACHLHGLRLPDLVRVLAPRFTSCEPHIPTNGLGIQNGEVVWSGLGYRTVQTVLSRDDLSAAVRHSPGTEGLALGGGGRWEATQLAALGPDRYAVVLDHRPAPWERILAVFEGTRLIGMRIGLVGPDDVVRPSSTGRYLALVRPQNVQVLGTLGGAIRLPSASRPHAVAWSPDDRWTALATPFSVYVFPTRRSDETVRIPLRVRDLYWGP